MEQIGYVGNIARFPVKSMRGESLDGVSIGPSGLENDRIGGFRHVGKQSDRNSQRFLTARELPGLVLMRPYFSSGQVRVNIPGHGDVDVVSAARILEVQSGKGPLEFLVDESARFQDRGQVSLVGAQSLQSVRGDLGDCDSGRFRMNLELVFSGKYAVPFSEDELLGRELYVGDAVLKVAELTARCPMINIDPLSGAVDPRVLRSIGQSRRGKLGVYANVVQPGQVSKGSSVYVV